MITATHLKGGMVIVLNAADTSVRKGVITPMNANTTNAKIVTGGQTLIAKPTYAIQCWWGSEQCVQFTEIRDMGIPQAKRWFDYHKLVIGKAATVWCFFSDYDIRDKDLNEAATRFMRGDYILVEVDLYNLTRKVSRGVNLIDHPRQ